MPSQKSLAAQEYYAHPQNCFWWLMAQVCDFSMSLDYEQRASALAKSGFAIWDVLHDCTRPGSLDANIVRDTEKPNDLQKMIQAHRSLKLIAFNGGAAQQIFMRHFPALLDNFDYLATVRLPSTSPAHASMSRLEKLQAWRNALGKQE